MSDFSAILSAAPFFRAARVARKADAFRPGLRGVRVEPHPQGGAIVIATTGHIAVALRDPWATVSRAATIENSDVLYAAIGPGSNTILMTDARAILVGTHAACRFQSPDPLAICADPAAAIVDDMGNTCPVLAQQDEATVMDDDRYGNITPACWRRLFSAPPDFSLPVTDSFDPRLLRQIARAFCSDGLRIYRAEEPDGARRIGNGHAHWVLPYAHRTSSGGGRIELAAHAVAVVMPMRAPSLPPALPGWWDAIATPTGKDA